MFRETTSGAKTDRREMARALKSLGEGDTVLVTRLDRLARSTCDLLNTLDTLWRTTGLSCLAITTGSARARSICRPKPPLASFAVRVFIRFTPASCDKYGRISNLYWDRRVRIQKNSAPVAKGPCFAAGIGFRLEGLTGGA